MSFVTYNYLVFLIVLWGAYWLLPRKAQNILLFFGSYVLYGAVHPWFCLLLLGISLNSFFFGQLIIRRTHFKKWWLWIGIGINLSVLAYFKYADFFIGNVNVLLETIGISEKWTFLHVFLPVGLSFYVFQASGFVIDCFQGKVRKTPPLLEFLLFVSFFPQLVAGPIERVQRLLPQFRKKRKFVGSQQQAGLLLILWGVFQKIVVADNVALFVDQIFAMHDPSTFLILVGTFGFTIQILSDFSAYTDIARGSAKLLGIELMENFRLPYLATNPSDFWKRWHISLSEWIRDYIYVPLGGNRASSPRRIFNILITMFLCGLWHGAAWTFVLWGIYHGLLLTFHRVFVFFVGTSKKLTRFCHTFFWRTTRVPLMFTATFFGWLLFRSQNVADLIEYFSVESRRASAEHFLGGSMVLLMMILYAAPLVVSIFLQYLPARYQVYKNFVTVPLTLLALLFFAAPRANEFIYFQF